MSKEYIRFTEQNDHEGETWHFYIPIKGNEKKIAKIRELIANEYAEDFYAIADKVYEETRVRILVEESDSGYMAQHNLVRKIAKLPNKVDWESEDPFYKGALFDCEAV